MSDRRANPWSSVAPRTLSILVLVASALGLLSVPIGFYDDSLMLMGARLVGIGKLPYIDFYAHYGPFGYTILSSLVHLFGDPGLALRIGEISVLAGIAILMHVLYRAVLPANFLREYAVPLIVVALSQIAMLPAFFGFGFTTAALVLFLFARKAVRKPAALLLNACGGVALAATALTRPAFAAYGAGAVLLLEAVARRPRFGALRNPLSTIGVFFGAAAFATLLTWLFLYPTISPALAFNATIVAPARLVGAGGARYRRPAFLPGAIIGGIAAGAALAATTVAWTFAVARLRVRRFAAAFITAGGLLPLVLILSRHPGRDTGLLALALFTLACLVAFAGREELKESALLRASALFGIVAAAFGHYFWARADEQHLSPYLTLALAGAALMLTELRVLGRVILLGIFVFAYASSMRNVSFPAATLLDPKILARLRPWRCTVFPEDALKAVALADSQSDPRSRFVAVGTSQAWSFGNPIYLFLLSSRLPYTRWFQYDPGLQDSPATQEEMERELEASGSRTAVVWKAGQYLWGVADPRKSRSAFDEFFDRLYPITAARFGDFAVRMRTLRVVAPPSRSPALRP